MVQWPWKSFSYGKMRLLTMEKCCIMGLLPWAGHALDVEACRDSGKQCFQDLALVVIRSLIPRCLMIMWKEHFHVARFKKNSNAKDYRSSQDKSTGLFRMNGHQLCSIFSILSESPCFWELWLYGKKKDSSNWRYIVKIML